MRTLLPCCEVLTSAIGVPKSVTSRRRRSDSGAAVLRKSTITRLPWSRMSTLVFGSDRSTRMRPSPSLPRRKSIERSARGPLGAAGGAVEAAATAAGAVGLAAAGRKLVVSTSPPRATWTTLPLTVTEWLTDRFRFRTSRVRSCAWTILTERRSPWLNSTALRPTLFSVAARSMAIRAGLATEKLGGVSFNGAFNWMVSNTPAAVCVASIRSTLLAAVAACARTATGPRAGTAAAANHAAARRTLTDILIACPLFAPLPAAPAWRGARPTRPPRPERLP